MSLLLQKQKFNELRNPGYDRAQEAGPSGRCRAQDGYVLVETYDTLQRHWPYSRRGGEPPFLIKAAMRMMQRRRHRPLPPRQAFKSTVDYYEALLPLMLAHQHLERSSAWRYVRPLMIRVMLSSWPRRPMF